MQLLVLVHAVDIILWDCYMLSNKRNYLVLIVVIVEVRMKHKVSDTKKKKKFNKIYGNNFEWSVIFPYFKFLE